MTSVILTRRAMLSSGAMLGLGALLAACGQQAANEAGHLGFFGSYAE